MIQRHASLLAQLEQQRDLALQAAAAKGCGPAGDWHSYKASEKVKKMQVLMAQNQATLKEVDALNDTVAQLGDSGEEVILDLLKACAVPRDSFWTEEDLKAQNALAIQEGRDPPHQRTPDFLFKEEVIINGKPVRWIDSKNNLIIPGITIPPQLSKFRRQINAYVDSIGPGAQSIRQYQHPRSVRIPNLTCEWMLNYCPDRFDHLAQLFLPTDAETLSTPKQGGLCIHTQASLRCCATGLVGV